MNPKQDIYYDNLSKEHLTKKLIIKGSLYIEQIIGEYINDFSSFIATDDFYEEIITDFNLSTKNKFAIAMENFDNFEFYEALEILNSLVKKSSQNNIDNNNLSWDGDLDLVLHYKFKSFIKLMRNILDEKIDVRNYTKEI